MPARRLARGTEGGNRMRWVQANRCVLCGDTLTGLGYAVLRLVVINEDGYEILSDWREAPEVGVTSSTFDSGNRPYRIEIAEADSSCWNRRRKEVTA
jgi:hypothetical protein